MLSRPCLAEPPAESPSTRKSSRERRIPFRAVVQLAGQGGDAHYRFSAGLARLARRLARGGGVDDLLDDGAGVGRIFLQPFGQLVGHQAFQRLANLGTDQLVLGLARKFGIGQLDRHDRRQALAHVLAGEADFLALQDARLVGIIVEGAGQCRAEGREVGAAVPLRDVVGEHQDVFVIAVVPLQRDIDADVVALPVDGDRVREQRGLGTVKIFDEGGDPAFVEQLMFNPVGVARIDQDDPHARIEEGELAKAMLEPLEVELDDLERFGRWQEGDTGTFLPLRPTSTSASRRRACSCSGSR